MSHSWEREYTNPTFISKDPKPKEDFLKFVKWLKKDQKVSLEELSALDLGCGAGRHSSYLAEHFDMKVVGIDFAKTAITLAQKTFPHPNISFVVQDLAEAFSLADESVDIAVDVMSSFALSSESREKYLKEINRVLKKGGYLYLRTLAREGDDNAKFLIKNNPGPEENTYLHPTLGTPETVFSKEDLERLYGRYFDIVKIEKKVGYQKFEGKSFKRQYWNCYLRKN